MAYPGNSWFLLFPSTMVGRGFWLWSFLLMLPWAGVAQNCLILAESPPSGDLQVSLLADKTTVRPGSSAGDANLITYTITITNTSEAPLEHIDFEGQLFDGNDEALAAGFFGEPDITTDDFPLTSFRLEQNPLRITGDLSLGPQESGEVKVQVELNDIPSRNILTARVSVFTSGLVDSDLKNNWATVESVVQTEGKDIMITKSTEDACFNPNPLDGNIITLSVTNTGTETIDFSVDNITMNLREDLSNAEAEITIIDAGAWDESGVNSNNKNFYFQKGTGALQPGETISGSYRITYGDNYSYNSAAKVTVLGNEEIESNNFSRLLKLEKEHIGTPDTGGEPVYLLLGEQSDFLTATGDEGNDLNWYYKEEGGTAFPGIKPSTAEPGSTKYYVSQSMGTCEGPREAIEVIVLAPAPGTLAGDQAFCRNFTSGTIGSTDAGVGDFSSDYEVSYRWQWAEPGTEVWNDIPSVEANTATYSPGLITDPLSFRRFTVLTRLADGKCVRSAPTESITVSVKPCAVTTNPMMPSRATAPQEP